MRKSLRVKYKFFLMFLGSIFLFFFSNAPEIYGGQWVKDKQFKSPVRICQGPGGFLLVSDYKAKAIIFFDQKNNKVKRGFAIKGHPLGIAFYKNNIYIGNKTNKRVEVYSLSGIKKRSFHSAVKKPNDIVIDKESKRLYVTDTTRKNIKVFDLEGKLLFTILDHLYSPTGIAFDEVNGLLYVSDYGDRANYIYPSITIFNGEGEYEGTISGKQGMFGNRFSRPQGLAIGDNGYIFMVDCYSAEIMVFNGPGGVLVKTIGGYGTTSGKLRLPLDIVLNERTKDFFITNNGMASVQIFRDGGQI